MTTAGNMALIAEILEAYRNAAPETRQRALDYLREAESLRRDREGRS